MSLASSSCLKTLNRGTHPRQARIASEKDKSIPIRILTSQCSAFTAAYGVSRTSLRTRPLTPETRVVDYRLAVARNATAPTSSNNFSTWMSSVSTSRKASSYACTNQPDASSTRKSEHTSNYPVGVGALFHFWRGVGDGKPVGKTTVKMVQTA